MRARAVLLLAAVGLAGCGPSADGFRLDGSSGDACHASLAELREGPDANRADRAVEALLAEAVRQMKRRDPYSIDMDPELDRICAGLDGATLDEVLAALE